MPRIFDCDLYNKNIHDQLPFFKSLFDHQLGELVNFLREQVCSFEVLKPFSFAGEAANALTLKRQINEGEVFPWHYDNSGKPNIRWLAVGVYRTEIRTMAWKGRSRYCPLLKHR